MEMKRLLATAAVAVLLLAGEAYSQPRTKKADFRRNAVPELLRDNILVDAVQAMEDGRLEEAIGSLEKLAASDPANDAAFYYLGLANLYARNLEEARDALKKAAALDPGNYWYKDRLALACSLLGEDDLTIATYEELLREFPKKNEIYFNLVNLYLKNDRTEEALAAMDQIETVFGKNEQVTSTRYNILLRQDKPKEALQTLLDYNSEFSSPTILTMIGDYEMAEYKDTSALSRYMEALDLQGDYMPAVLGAAEVYRIRKDYPEYFSYLGRFISDEATQASTKAQYLGMLMSRIDSRFINNCRPQLDSIHDRLVACNPTDSVALSTAGSYYYATDRKVKSESLFRRNLKANPRSLNAVSTCAQFLSERKDWTGITELCDSVLGYMPGDPGILDLKTYACYQMKDYEGIIANCNEILGRFASDTARTKPALATLGDAYYEMGKVKEAFKAYDKALKIDPGYVPVLNNYAWYLAMQKKNLKKAAAMSRKTIEKEPDNPTYLDTYGWILHLQGKDKDARTYFKHAMLYGGREDPTCLRHFATVLDALGETDLAKVYRSQAESREAREATSE